MSVTRINHSILQGGLLLEFKDKIPVVCGHVRDLRMKINPLSGQIIQCSRIDQALCDEAEAGRAHGDCIIDNGCLMLLGGQGRIHLNQGFCWGFGQRDLAYPLDHFADGQPLIETAGANWPITSNGYGRWRTQFPYLRASVFSRIFGNCFDTLGVSDIEYLQAVALGGKWEFTGNWGDKNRLVPGGNWHDDDSLLTILGDSCCESYWVNDAHGVPQYAVELIDTPNGKLLLPYRYLKRVGFWGPRRVFFPPEENIAIWYKLLPDEKVKNIILTDNPVPLLHCNVTGATAIGCVPGGAASVNKTDISTLRGRECCVWIIDINDRNEVEFAVKMTARIRQEYITPHVFHLGKNNFDRFCSKEISISELGKIAKIHNIFVPEELRCEYLGDLTELITKYKPVSVIDEVLTGGEVMSISERDTPHLLLAIHIAKRLQQGHNIFEKFWRVSQPQHTAVILDRGSARIARRYSPLNGVTVKDCCFIDFKPDERVKAFFAMVGSARVVIIAALELIADCSDFCLEILQQCVNRDIAVIIFSEVELPAKIRRVVTRSCMASRIDGNKGLSIAVVDNNVGDASVEARFDVGGVLLDSKKLSARKRDMVSPVKAVPALPPDKQMTEELAQLPPEQKLQCLKNKSKK